MATGRRMKVKVESETSELHLEVKETEKVENLMKTIKKAWADGTDFINLYYKGEEMKKDQPLSFYHIVDGSVIKLKVSADHA